MSNKWGWTISPFRLPDVCPGPSRSAVRILLDVGAVVILGTSFMVSQKTMTLDTRPLFDFSCRDQQNYTSPSKL
ncbi:hypothetical protein GE21DRAFT_1078520 [Neurospora crassa]|nr:hypothetical protein GE21DRAFT_1078520 [Neurospora crassa]